MATQPTTNPGADQLINLKQAFEAAVQELDGEKADPSRQPIYPRKVLAPKSESTDQNRALDEAAQALAALWKTAARRTTPRRTK